MSTVSFSVDGGGNRALVLIPFMIIISAFFVKKLLEQKTKYKIIIILILVFGTFFQIAQSASWISVKYFVDPRESSSLWIQKNISKESTIGIESIPIYQMLPDFVLKEFYLKQRDNNLKTRYKYSVVSSLDNSFPEFVIITNDFDNLNYIKESPKKDLVNKLKNKKYRKIIDFTPNLKYYNLFADKQYFILANIMPIPVSISIYEK